MITFGFALEKIAATNQGVIKSDAWRVYSIQYTPYIWILPSRKLTYPYISHIGKRKIIFKHAFSGEYVSSLEATQKISL